MNDGRVSIHVLVNDKPITEVYHEGGIFVEGRDGTEYKLSIENLKNKRVLVVPSIDGLSVLNGKVAGENSPGYVLEARQKIIIPGWKVDGNTAAKFEFRPKSSKTQRKTYVEEVGEDTSNQGVMGFLVYNEKVYPVNDRWSFSDNRSWSNDPIPPYKLMKGGSLRSVTAQASFNSATPEPTMGTGFGEETRFKTQKVEFEKDGNPTVIIFQYDTLQGLKKRGVPVEKFYSNTRNSPNPFPASPHLVNNEGCPLPKNWRRK